jgi:hypothetical protein
MCLRFRDYGAGVEGVWIRLEKGEFRGLLGGESTVAWGGGGRATRHGLRGADRGWWPGRRGRRWDGWSASMERRRGRRRWGWWAAGSACVALLVEATIAKLERGYV